MSMITGFFTALITPFLKDGSVDESGLRMLLNKQIEGGADGIVLLGTTGETPTLTDSEKKRITAIAREEIGGKIKLIVGTGTYSTKQTIENTRAAEKLGADAAIIVTPYYNKPTQEGLYLHYQSIAEATDLPILIYNIAGRTGQNLQTETLKRLMQYRNIAGVKESSGSITQISDVIEMSKEIREDFSVLCGDDALTLPSMALGAHGVISVVGNIVPDQVKALVTALQNDDMIESRQLHFTLMPLIRMAFLETNPIPIKAAMERLGLPAGACRPPLCPLSKDNEAKLGAILESLKELRGAFGVR